MKKKSFEEIVSFYKKRFSYHQGIISFPIKQGTAISVVIPCFNEPNLLGTLQSLASCEMPNCTVEILVIINNSENVSEAISQQNGQTFLEANNWAANCKNSQLTFHILNFDNLPTKHAGVGLARKIGMDEALIRFADIKTDGTIVCLDADCSVSENYFTALETQFANKNFGLGHFHFEHLLENNRNENLKKGIVNYELFLRFYVEALKYSNFPYAVQTIGSCMIVRASVYALQGGMNRRKAGEDFYFIHKILPHTNFVSIRNAKVFPAARVSDRVPFGTGKAQQDWLDGASKIAQTYPFEIFEDLKMFLEQKNSFFEITNKAEYKTQKALLPLSVQQFLEENNFFEKLLKINKNSKTENNFNRKFFEWFDGFTILKFVHFARDNFYEVIPLKKVCLQMLEKMGFSLKKEYSAEELLMIFRKLEENEQFVNT